MTLIIRELTSNPKAYRTNRCDLVNYREFRNVERCFRPNKRVTNMMRKVRHTMLNEKHLMAAELLGWEIRPNGGKRTINVIINVFQITS